MDRDVRPPLVARDIRVAAWKLDDADGESSACIAVTRNLLKSELIYDRGELTALGWLPICPICGKPMQAPDMHEAIITRGDVMGLPMAHKVKIFVRENCVLVHSGRCHIQAATKEGTRKCILHLVEKEGLIAILEWPAKMEGVLLKELLNKAMSLINTQADRPQCECQEAGDE